MKADSQLDFKTLTTTPAALPVFLPPLPARLHPMGVEKWRAQPFKPKVRKRVAKSPYIVQVWVCPLTSDFLAAGCIIWR